MPLKGDYEPSPSVEARRLVEQYEASAGLDSTTVFGRPVVILTSVGARTGKLRKTPLIRVEHDGDYALVASRRGAPTNPQWYYNLLANPRVELQDGSDKHDYLAREVTGEEREMWWKRAVRVWPDYEDYARRTDRVIPVFVLTRQA